LLKIALHYICYISSVRLLGQAPRWATHTGTLGERPPGDLQTLAELLQAAVGLPDANEKPPTSLVSPPC
jgi:hypothetical protein